jgi:preprotein translocase subunit SecA
MSTITQMPANRSSLARRKRRDLARKGWIEGVVAESKKLAKNLEGASRADLHAHTHRLRQFVKTETAADDPRVLALSAAAVIEAVRQVLSLQMFDSQVHAGLIVSRGAVAEMQTGEGKTLSVAVPAYVRALASRGVHVATPNSYLASRDHQKLAPVFSLLGMNAGLLKEDASSEETRAAYRADITYGPGHSFGFDYLRDQLILDRINSPRLGHRVYSRFCGEMPETKLLQRGLFASIIDEIDHVLIDDAVSPLILSGSSEGESLDAEVHREARVVAESLRMEADFEKLGHGNVQMTDSGFERVYARSDMVIHPQLVRPWHEYVVLALRASHCYLRDVHYVIQNEQLQIVDTSTGRIFEDRTWAEGLHQAIEAREGLQISCETTPLARITRQRFYRYYDSLGGMTGTATGCEKEFASVYGLPVSVVPLRTPSRRIVFPEHVSRNENEKMAAIGDETESIAEAGRAVLIGTINIAESLEMANELISRGLTFELLNGIQDADEAAIVARAGQPGAITVATNLAGRGTDIALGPSVAECGGLHVIVTQNHTLERVDRQLIGRCARCGDPGTARIYVSAEDTLPHQHAPWLGRAIKRWDDHGRPAKLSLEHRFRKVQSNHQRMATAHRWRLLQSDRDDEKLLNRSAAAPTGCWQL